MFSYLRAGLLMFAGWCGATVLLGFALKVNYLMFMFGWSVL
jgi:hypothetical protein